MQKLRSVMVAAALLMGAGGAVQAEEVVFAEEQFTIVVNDAGCNLPWGGVIQPGEAVRAYSDDAPVWPQSCSFETRVCQADGTLSGSFSGQTCGQVAQACSGPGREMINGVCKFTSSFCPSGWSQKQNWAVWYRNECNNGCSFVSAYSQNAVQTSFTNYFSAAPSRDYMLMWQSSSSSCNHSATYRTCTSIRSEIGCEFTGPLQPFLDTIAFGAEFFDFTPPAITGASGALISVDLKDHVTFTPDNPGLTTADISWSVISAGMPTGMSLQGTGLLTGTPTTAGSFTVRIRAEAGDQTKDRDFDFTIEQGSCEAFGGQLVNGVCRFNANSCPTGWRQVENWATYASRTCSVSRFTSNLNCVRNIPGLFTAPARAWSNQAGSTSRSYSGLFRKIGSSCYGGQSYTCSSTTKTQIGCEVR